MTCLFNLYIGCPNSPAKGSRLCLGHKKIARVYQDENPDSNESHVGRNEDDIVLIKKILNKKETRQGYYYQVSFQGCIKVIAINIIIWDMLYIKPDGMYKNQLTKMVAVFGEMGSIGNQILMVVLGKYFTIARFIFSECSTNK